ncbi:hypothetical protein CLOM621_08590 [Clostridium sp. M62/1]|nr:hypothetical protein CLOM621_08590 [Clostridium sp. M62/1]
MQCEEYKREEERRHPVSRSCERKGVQREAIVSSKKGVKV